MQVLAAVVRADTAEEAPRLAGRQRRSGGYACRHKAILAHSAPVAELVDAQG
jgi:hypothetical protein